MEAFPDGDPLRAVTIQVGLVHRHRDMRQLDLADQTVEGGMHGRSRMAEPVRAADQPAEVIDPDTRFGRGGRRIGQESEPAAHEPASGADGELVALVEEPVGRRDRGPVDRQGESARFDQGSIRLRQAARQPSDVERPVDRADLEPDVAERLADRLGPVDQLVGPELRPVAVVVVLEPGRRRVAGPRCDDREPIA